MDAQVLEVILKDAEPDKRAREIGSNLIARLRKHTDNPKFTALGERLVQKRLLYFLGGPNLSRKHVIHLN